MRFWAESLRGAKVGGQHQGVHVGVAAGGEGSCVSART